jgi:hypothetical protein
LKNSDVAEPKPKPDEALSGVEAFLLNHGELPKLGFFPEGTTGGWDSAGRVIQPAADGSGPRQINAFAPYRHGDLFLLGTLRQGATENRRHLLTSAVDQAGEINRASISAQWVDSSLNWHSKETSFVLFLGRKLE